MAGLLDFVQTPEGQGLLSAAFGGLAGARRGQPINSLGRAGLAGLAGYSGAQDRALQLEESAFNKQYKTAQLTKMQQEMAATQARNDFLRGLSGAPTDALGAGAAVGDVGPTKTNAARMDGNVPAGLQRIPRSAIEAEIALNGGKNIPEWMFKSGMPDMQVSNGYAYDKNSTQPGYMPQMSVSNDGKATQVTVGPDGVPTVGAPRGALATYGQYRNLDASTTAAYDTMPITLPDGTTMMTTRKDVVESGRKPSSNPAPVRPTGNFTGNGYAGGSAGAAANDQRAIMTRERQSAVAAGNTELVAALDREMARLPGASQGAAPAQGFNSPVPGIQIQSEAEKQGAIERAKADAKANSGEGLAAKEAKRASVQAQIGVIDKAINHPGRATATGLSGVLDPRNYIPGTKATDFKVVLDQLGGAAFLQAFESLKGGGQITEVEGKKATDAIARLNRAQSDEEFGVALSDLREVMTNGLSRLDGTGGASGSFDAPKPGKGRVVKTGMYNGKKVVQYEDGSTDYAN